MEIVFQLLIVLFIIWFAYRMFGPAKGVNNIHVAEVKEKIGDRNVLFIDVRTPGEYKMNNRKPFKNIPLDSLGEKLQTLDKNKEVVVICQSGMRSKLAARMFVKHGFEKVVNVKGGMNAWGGS